MQGQHNVVELVVSELTSRREIDSTSAPHCQSVPRVDELAATGLRFFELHLKMCYDD